MSKYTFGFNADAVMVEVPVEREVELVVISDGVYKYIYADTKEDVI